MQIHTIRTNIAEVKTDTLKLKTKLTLIEINKTDPSPQPIDTNNIGNINISKGKIPDKLVRHLGTFHDIQVPILNKFNTLSNDSPLPYKTVVTGSSSKPHDLYHVKYIEHSFLTNLKAPSIPSLQPLIQKSFGSFHYLSDNLVKTQEFYQLIHTDS